MDCIGPDVDDHYAQSDPAVYTTDVMPNVEHPDICI